MLIVFDHVSDEEQVVSMLPAAGVAVTVLICSRPPLPGLPADAVIELEPLTPGGAVTLLRSVIGGRAVEDDRPAAYDLVELCGRVPQWITIVGQDLVDRGLRVTDAVAELRRNGASFDAGHLLDHTLREFPAAVREAFALIGRLDAEDVTVPRLAALQDVSEAAAQASLTALTHARLLTVEAGTSHYRMSTILRNQASRLELRTTAWSAALNRATAHLIDETGTVAESVGPGTKEIDPFAWFEENGANVVGGAQQALTEGDPAGVWRLLTAVQPILSELVDTAVWRHLVDLAEEAIRKSDDVAGRAHVLMSRGHLHRFTPDYQAAFADLDAAVQLLRTTDDRLALARALDGRADFAVGLARTAGQTHRYRQADEDLQEARGLFEAVGDLAGVGSALNSLGELRFFTTGPAEAAECLVRSLAVQRALPSPLMEAVVQRMLGTVFLQAEDLAGAEQSLAGAIAINARIGNQVERARAQLILGEVYVRSGRPAAATDQFRAALTVLAPRHDARWLARVHQALGSVLAGRAGEHAEARDHLEKARDLYLRIDEAEAVRACEHALAELARPAGSSP